MKALVYEGPRQMQIREVPEPEPEPEEVLIKVAFSGICGSELSGYLGQSSIRKPPLVMGHEFSGTIAALGPQALQHNPDLALGQRVTANPLLYCGRCRPCLAGRQNLCVRRQLIGAHRPGSYAEYVNAHARMVFPLPDHLSLEHAALAEPLACAIRAVRLAECAPPGRVLVIGLGPIGLLIAQAARAFGVTALAATDLDPDRRAIAAACGIRALDPAADDIVGLLQAETDGLGVEVVIDAVGLTVTRRQAVDAVAAGGRVVLIGLHEEESPFPVNPMIRREISLLGTFAYTPNEFGDALAWLAAGRIQIDPWLIKAPLAEGRDCFERLLGRPGPVAKILLH